MTVVGLCYALFTRSTKKRGFAVPSASVSVRMLISIIRGYIYIDWAWICVYLVVARNLTCPMLVRHKYHPHRQKPNHILSTAEAQTTRSKKSISITEINYRRYRYMDEHTYIHLLCIYPSHHHKSVCFLRALCGTFHCMLSTREMPTFPEYCCCALNVLSVCWVFV